MNFKGRSAKRFTANSTNNLKKAWAVQREAKKAKQEAKEQIITDELKKVKYQLYLKRKRERYMEKKKSEGKIVLSADDYDKVTAILENFRNDDLAQKYCKGVIELSHYGKHEDLDVRVRPDCLNVVEGFISDVKTCQDNSPMAFKRDVYKYAYHLQAAFYMDMIGVSEFRFIAVESNYPHSIEVYSLGEEMIEQGRRAWKSAFADWKLYIDTGIISNHIWDEFNDDGSKIL